MTSQDVYKRQLQSTDLDTVTVTASRGAALASLDVSTTTISAAQVEAAPENTVDQIVNKIPGVFTSQVPAAQLHPCLLYTSRCV